MPGIPGFLVPRMQLSEKSWISGAEPAVRVPPAVTWLTVYRWLYMTRRAGQESVLQEGNTAAGSQDMTRTAGLVPFRLEE